MYKEIAAFPSVARNDGVRRVVCIIARGAQPVNVVIARKSAAADDEAIWFSPREESPGQLAH